MKAVRLKDIPAFLEIVCCECGRVQSIVIKTENNTYICRDCLNKMISHIDDAKYVDDYNKLMEDIKRTFE